MSAGHTPCTMGVGCDEYGICYAEAHGQPDQCPKAPSLIAAAPELLLMLEALAGAAAATPGFASPLILSEAHKTIAKAKGGAQ